MKYAYYDFRGRLARGNVDIMDYDDLRTRFEFYDGGTWAKDEERSLHLSDAMMDYGGYSPSDYEDLTVEQAMQMIEKLDKGEKR